MLRYLKIIMTFLMLFLLNTNLIFSMETSNPEIQLISLQNSKQGEILKNEELVEIKKYIMEKGFSVVAMNYKNQGKILNDYIHSIPVSLEKELNYTPWNTKEFKIFLDWLRSYNSQNKESEKINFLGLCVELTEFTFQTGEKILSRNNANKLKGFRHICEILKDHSLYQALTIKEKEKLKKDIKNIQYYIEEHRSDITANDRERDYVEIFFCLKKIKETEEIFSFNQEYTQQLQRILQLRERLIADQIIEYYRENGKKKKIILLGNSVKKTEDLHSRDFYLKKYFKENCEFKESEVKK